MWCWQEADIAAAGLSVLSERMRVVDFTYPFMDWHHAAIIMKRHSRRAGIRSLRDLARQTNISYAVVDSGLTKNFFRTSTDPDYARMWTQMSRSLENFVPDTEDGVRRVRLSSDEHPWAFMISSQILRYVTSRLGQTCDMEVVEDVDAGGGYALALPLNSPYLDRLSLAVVMMRESGRMNAIRRQSWPECGSTAHNL